MSKYDKTLSRESHATSIFAESAALDLESSTFLSLSQFLAVRVSERVSSV